MTSPALAVYVNASSVWVVSLLPGHTVHTSVFNNELYRGGWCTLHLHEGGLTLLLTGQSLCLSSLVTPLQLTDRIHNFS